MRYAQTGPFIVSNYRSYRVAIEFRSKIFRGKDSEQGVVIPWKKAERNGIHKKMFFKSHANVFLCPMNGVQRVSNSFFF